MDAAAAGIPGPRVARPSVDFATPLQDRNASLLPHFPCYMVLHTSSSMQLVPQRRKEYVLITRVSAATVRIGEKSEEPVALTSRMHDRET